MSPAVPKRSSLETSAFPSAMLSHIGTTESWRKEIHRPATSTHKWWAKRLGSVFRGIIVSAVIPDGDDAGAKYASSLDLSELVVLDPFGGSGVTAVEALKLGAKAVCFDINPVATLVQRQALQRWDMASLRSTFAKIEESCRAEVDRVHLTEDGRPVLYYFWVGAADCPTCAVRVRLFDSPVFSRNAYPKRVPRAQLVCPDCLDLLEDRYDFTSVTCHNAHEITPQAAVSGQHATCCHGHTFRILDALDGGRPTYEMYAKLVANHDGTKSYEPISEWDKTLYAGCARLLERLPKSAVLPVGSLTPGNNTNQALNWNFREWRDFFNARQLYSLSLIATAIRDVPGAGPEREALCALFSGTLEFNNLFTSFKGEGTGAVRHMFAHHILKPERTPLEAHPWGTPQSSGAFSTLVRSRLYRAHEYKTDPADLVITGAKVKRVTGLSRPVAATIATAWATFAEASGQAAYVASRNSANTDLPYGSVDLVICDPPYMDNVHYSELADFFHAWLRAMRPYVGYPTNDTTRQAGEVQQADPVEFGTAIEAVWTECARCLRPGGLLAFTFHQARISGWVQVIESLMRSGFVVTAVQPVKGEMTRSIVKSGAREPSNLDSIVVCRRAVDGASNLSHSIDAALATAQKELATLRDAGIDVGAGDIRSVVRGSLLAHLAATGVPLDAHAEAVVDSRATATIRMILG
jgi:putative DNA methylase